MKKYSVSAEEKKGITISVFEKKNNSLQTTQKTDAISFAKKLSKIYNVVSFNADTYKDGACIKNEFGRYENGKVEIYSTITYNKPVAKKLQVKISDFFGEDVLSKLRKK